MMPDLPSPLQMAIADVRAAQADASITAATHRLSLAVERLVSAMAQVFVDIYPVKSVVVDAEVIEDIDPAITVQIGQIVAAVKDSVPEKYWPEIVRRLGES